VCVCVCVCVCSSPYLWLRSVPYGHDRRVFRILCDMLGLQYHTLTPRERAAFEHTHSKHTQPQHNSSSSSSSSSSLLSEDYCVIRVIKDEDTSTRNWRTYLRACAGGSMPHVFMSCRTSPKDSRYPRFDMRSPRRPLLHTNSRQCAHSAIVSGPMAAVSILNANNTTNKQTQAVGEY
jgi:hypothetical protein